MAILDIDLAESGTQTISSDNADDTNTVNITALGSQELIVDGVQATVGSIGSVQAGASPIFTATNGGSLTVDQGLLNVNGLNNFTFNVEDTSDISLEQGDVALLDGVLNTYDVNFAGAEDGTFSYDKGTVGLASTINFNVTGMEAGDQFDLTGGGTLNGGSNWSVDNYSNGVLTLSNGNGLTNTQVNANIEMTQAQYDDFVANQDQYLSGGNFTYNCFAAGTLIATPEGDVAVEDLTIGDLVMTANGDQVPVKWIGRQTVSRLTAVRQPPVRIRQGALGGGKPQQDLVLTGGHGMIIDGLVINAAALVNGDTIDYVPQDELQGTMTYFHVETDSHEAILANGAEAETYIDYIDRQAFDNYAEYIALYGIETRIIEMPRHRISSRRLLPLALRERLGIQDMTPATRTA
ncbi:Hint domain-containing protein [Halomonas elongata]|uniref:Hint domain-containing protein n=1 Tax=Halomonas elongata TaxID=2746 RepID=UPI00335CA9D1